MGTGDIHHMVVMTMTFSFGAIHNKRVMSRFLVFLASHPCVCVMDAVAFVNLILQELVKASVHIRFIAFCQAG